MFWSTFCRIIECDKTQRTIYRGPQVILIIIVELIGIVFLGPKWLLKTQFFGK